MGKKQYIDTHEELEELKSKLEEMQLSSDSAHVLIEQNSKFKLMVQNMGHGLVFVDNDDIIRYVNKSYCDMFGFEPEELIGMNSFNLVENDEDKKLLEEKKQLRFKGISDIYNIRVKKKDGESIWVEINGTSVKDDYGEVIGTLGMVSDISDIMFERQKLEKQRKIIDAVAYCNEKFLTMDDFEAAINEVLDVIRDASGVDRVCIYENFEIDGLLYSSQKLESCSDGVNPHLSDHNYQNIPYEKAGFARWIDHFTNGGVIFGSVDDLPDPGKELLKSLGLKSIVAIPIFLSGKWWGFLALDEFNASREWLTVEIDALKKAASGIGHGMENWLAKKHLKKNQEDLSHLFEFAPTGMELKDIRGKIIKVNKAFCEILGYTEEEFVGKDFREITYPEDLEKELQLNQLLLKEEIPFAQIEKRYIGKEGNIVNALLQVSLEKDPLGNPIYYFAQIIDITERKNAELEKANLEKIYRAIFENANDAIFIEDENENIIDANAHATDLTGYDRNELLNMRTVELQPTEYESYEMRLDERFETKLVRKDGNVLDVELTLSQIRLGEKNMIISVVRDMTDKMKAQEEMRNAKEKAEESDRVKSHFLAQMSHEIRTPINAILGYSTLIKDELGDNIDEETKSNFEIIESASQRLMRTIDLILRMSEIQTGNYNFVSKKLDLHSQILDQLYKQFKVIAKSKGLEFSLKKNTESTGIIGDEFSVMQIFSNLISNAIKYTIEGKVEVIIWKNDEKTYVDVTDTGIGISKEYQPHLFQMFSQEEQGYTRKFEGNGLGLALVKKYCEMNNASIDVISEKHKGSTFRVGFTSK